MHPVLPLLGLLLLGACASDPGNPNVPRSGTIHLGSLRVTEASRLAEQEKLKPKSGTRTDQTGRFDVPKDAPLRVVFQGSPSLTQAWRDELAGRGWRVSDTGAPLTIRGVYGAKGRFPPKGRLDTGLLDIAELVEKAQIGQVADKGGSSLPAAQPAAYVALAPNVAQVAAGTAGMTAMSALFHATGLTERLNRGVDRFFGTDEDPYKYCMFGCDGDRAAWNQPAQVATLTLEYAGRRWDVTVANYDPVLDPAGVIGQAMTLARTP